MTGRTVDDLERCIMADRVSAHIMIGGQLPETDLPDLIRAIETDGPTVDWDGTPFTLTNICGTEPLALMDHEVAWGRFAEIEDCCERLGLSYVRWAGSYSGSFPATRVLYTGSGERETFLTTEDDTQVFAIEHIRELGSMEAIEAEYGRARCNPPPLIIVQPDSTDDVREEAGHD